MPADRSVLRSRRARLVASAFADGQARAVLITRLVNIRWLCGFSGSNAALLLTPEVEVLATDGRYTLQASEESPDVELLTARGCAPALAARAASDGVKRLLVEAHDVTLELAGKLAAAAEGVEIGPLGHVVEGLREAKDEQEIGLLRAACAIGDRAFAALLPELRPGLTERQVARRLEALMGEHGADAPAFETIAAAGPSGAVPHHQPTDRELVHGDLLTLDFGARHEGYHSDMTRTVAIGRPAEWQREIYALVEAAQAAGRQALVADAPVDAVESACRGVIDNAGYGEHLVHPVSHGVGLEVHEAPMLQGSANGRLAFRTSVTVEPGVYLPGRGGVRIEDVLVVRDSGAGPANEILTTTTKDLLVL